MSILNKNPPRKQREKRIDTAEEYDSLSDGQDVEVVYKSLRNGKIKSSRGTVKKSDYQSGEEIKIHSEKHSSNFNHFGKIYVTESGHLKNTFSRAPIFGIVKAILRIDE